FLARLQERLLDERLQRVGDLRLAREHHVLGSIERERAAKDRTLREGRSLRGREGRDRRLERTTQRRVPVRRTASTRRQEVETFAGSREERRHVHDRQ